MNCFVLLFFFFNDTATTEIYTLSLHDALPIFASATSIIFVLDPLQDPATRQLIKVNDPQVDLFEKGGSSRQDLIILETADRIRKLKGMTSEEPIDIPMIFAINKFDAWSSLLTGVEISSNPVIENNNGKLQLDYHLIEDVNKITRNMLSKHVPDWIDSIDSISSNATIIPCAPLGI